ncbi:surfactin synthase thioesterase subunit [Catenulispora sp. GAS73]|uniref:thioesterase II family protein n=1 Tax=Catenulispora sp. GAS73 TaxID=3156269 RepID=UPI003512BCD4
MAVQTFSAQDTAVVRPEPRPNAVRTLICLGFCGGGTGAYRAWLSCLEKDVELALVCYPGREGRFAEPYAADWEQLAEDAADSVARVVAADPGRPYEVFGHSMGGWMAFDVVVRLAARGCRLPERLIVSSCNAPDRGVTDLDRFPRIEDTRERLLEWMETIGALPDYAREDPDLCDMAVELMQADIRVRDSYRPAPGANTTVPVLVLYGEDDPVIEPALAEQWARCAAGGSRTQALPGNHFYTPATWEKLPTYFLTDSTLTPEGSR